MSRFNQLSKAFQKEKGIYQWWKKPLEVTPMLSVLERGPDYSFLDGRKPKITSKRELEWRKKQVLLATKVVQYLNEIKDAEKLYQAKQLESDLERKRIVEITLKAKGDQTIC